jgi:hypothetical protein
VVIDTRQDKSGQSKSSEGSEGKPDSNEVE